MTVHRKDVPRAFQGIFGSWTLVPGLLDQGLEAETEYAITVTFCQKDAFQVLTVNGERITVNDYGEHVHACRYHYKDDKSD